MAFITVGKNKVHYVVEGEGDALILIHDLFEDHLHWSKIQKELAKHFKVIAIDLRGSGESSMPKESFTIEDCAKDVIALADEMKIEKFHVLGDSLGGAVGQTLAYKFPERVDKLILSNAFLTISKATEWFLDMAEELFKGGQSYLEVYKLILPWFFSAWFLNFEKDIEELLGEIKKRKHPLKPKAYTFQLEALKKFDSTKWIKKIKAPVLMVIGEEDIFTHFRESRALKGKIENNQVELCPGGHKSKIECPTRFLEVVTKFLLGQL